MRSPRMLRYLHIYQLFLLSISRHLSPWHVIDTNTPHRIFQIPKLGTKLKQDSMPLTYTPRKFIPHPTNGLLYLIEGDHRVMSEEAASKKLQEMVCGQSHLLRVAETDTSAYKRERGERIDEEVLSLAPELFGRPKAPAGTWASCIRIINPLEVRLSASFSHERKSLIFSTVQYGQCHPLGQQRGCILYRDCSLRCPWKRAALSRRHCSGHIPCASVMYEWFPQNIPLCQ